jgi:hypothetical protein
MVWWFEWKTHFLKVMGSISIMFVQHMFGLLKLIVVLSWLFINYPVQQLYAYILVIPNYSNVFSQRPGRVTLGTQFRPKKI